MFHVKHQKGGEELEALLLVNDLLDKLDDAMTCIENDTEVEGWLYRTGIYVSLSIA